MLAVMMAAPVFAVAATWWLVPLVGLVAALGWMTSKRAMAAVLGLFVLIYWPYGLFFWS